MGNNLIRKLHIIEHIIPKVIAIIHDDNAEMLKINLSEVCLGKNINNK